MMLDVRFHGPVTCSMRRTGNIGDPFNSADSLLQSVEILARRAEWYWYHVRFIVCLLRKWSSTTSCCFFVRGRVELRLAAGMRIYQSPGIITQTYFYMHNKLSHIRSSTRLRKKGIALVSRNSLQLLSTTRITMHSIHLCHGT